MSVKVTDNTPMVKFSIDSRISIALRYMLDAIDSTALPRTPKNIGHLRGDILKSVIGRRGTIRWMVNYAIYQETKQFKNYTTSGTGPHFAENAVRKIANDSITYFKKAQVI